MPTDTTFETLLYAASKSLRYHALKFTQNTEDANDLIQETLYKALKNKSKFTPGTEIKAWLFVILRNTFINKYHRIDKRNKSVDPIEYAYELIGPETTDYNQGITSMNMEQIQKAINKLEEQYKKPFLMHFQGYKYEEIVQELGCPMGTVKNRIHIARKLLMQDLTDLKF